MILFLMIGFASKIDIPFDMSTFCIAGHCE